MQSYDKDNIAYIIYICYFTLHIKIPKYTWTLDYT